jgi:catechol 2,3-dioxygenase-like lactoylglutathione lyase family enzyme
VRRGKWGSLDATMEISRPRFVIAVPDLQKSAAFYRDILGFRIESISAPGWLIYSSGTCVIMAGECPEAIPPSELGDHSYFAYLEVAAIDELHASVCAAGVKLCKSLRDEPWGMREFGVVTADGHRIMFASPRAGAGAGT